MAVIGFTFRFGLVFLGALAARESVAALPAAFDDVAQVGLGVEHTCALSRQGTVSCWGSNYFGQLGVGDASGLTVRSTPVPVSGLSPGIRAIAVGGYHACGITAARGVKCWGWNGYGQLGDGSDAGGATPVDVLGLGGPVVALSGGVVHSCALLENGSVQCWGANFTGQLGDGTTTNRLQPVTVGGLAAAGQIDAGAEHTCAILVDGAVKCWGRNDSGQLGDGTNTDRTSPVSVQQLPAGAARSVAAGARATCAVGATGAVFCWGAQYPLGAFEGGSNVARAYPGFESGFVSVDSGTFHVCALVEGGAIKCLGDNSNGQFGIGPIDGSLGVDTAVGLAPGVVQVATGGDQTCARNSAGGLQCWGRNTSGELGLDSITKRLVPSQVAGLTSGIATVAAGGFHGCALTTTGGVKCWGANNQSQIGDDSDRLRLTPVDVVGLQSGVRALAVGADSSCVITAARRAKCWGANFDGRLGNGAFINSGVPVDVVGLGNVDVLAVTLGSAHGCALLDGGAVKCWGANDEGQLGDGSTQGKPSAVDVIGLGSGVRAITAGFHHTCAVTAGNGLKCWGENRVGQLGDGSNTRRTTPVDVVGLGSGVIAVGAGEQHTCAVRSGGAVQCWGFNHFGTILGDESTVDRAVPGDVPALRSGVVEIALAGYRSCVRTSGGAMQCWGDPIGDNSELSRPTPTQVAGLGAGVTSIDTGFGGHSCAVVDGAAKCWGENTFAQVGDGTTHGVPTPQTVVTNELVRRVGPVVPDANNTSSASRTDASGRYVVFQSSASNLVPGDSNGASDVFRTDRETGETIRISVDTGGAQIGGASFEPAISGDGLLVVFVAPDAAVGKLLGESAVERAARRKSNHFSVLMRNIVAGSTQRMGTALAGGVGTRPQIAPSATAVVFASASPSTAQPSVFHVPLTRTGDSIAPGTPRCISCKAVSASGADTSTDANGESRNAVVSADGRFVAFESRAKNVLASAPSPCPGSSAEIMLRDLLTGVMQRMSPPPTTPTSACGTTGSTQPSLDYAGAVLAFQTDQSLQGSDRNGVPDVYAMATSVGAVPERVSEAPQGVDPNGESSAPRVSGDGLSVAFVSSARNLDLSFADNNDRADVHTARLDGVAPVARLSRTVTGAEADAASERPAINFDGSRLAFDSASAALGGSGGGVSNVFQRSNPLAPPPRSATWWKESESGWGLTVFDQGDVLAPTWFTYDSDGEPTWFIVGGAFLQPDGSFRGDLLRLTGVRFDQINGAAATSATPIGNVVLRYGSEDALAFEYTALGTTQTKTLSRFPFGTRGFTCSATPSASRDRATNYTDLWTGADAADAGWGLTVFHIDDGVFAIWYTYDLDGEATFFVISAARQGDGSFSGPVFKQRNGTPFLQIADLPPSPDADTVGDATFRFTDGDSATFSYTLAGVSQSKPIQRLVVGSRPTECTSETLPAGR